MQKFAWIIVYAAVISVITTGCKTYSEWKYNAGDYVKHKLDGRVGIIANGDHYGSSKNPAYMVRFSGVTIED